MQVTSTTASATQQFSVPGMSGASTPVVDTPIAHAVEAHGIEGALNDTTGMAGMPCITCTGYQVVTVLTQKATQSLL